MSRLEPRDEMAWRYLRIHPVWYSFIKYCEQLRFGEVEKLKIQDGLPMLAEEVRRKIRTSRDFSFIMVDIDDFKRVNDQHGHLTGDSVLAAVVNKCRQSTRGEDVLARYGGEEFCILLPGPWGLSRSDSANREPERGWGRCRPSRPMTAPPVSPRGRRSERAFAGVSSYRSLGACVRTPCVTLDVYETHKSCA